MSFQLNIEFQILVPAADYLTVKTCDVYLSQQFLRPIPLPGVITALDTGPKTGPALGPAQHAKDRQNTKQTHFYTHTHTHVYIYIYTVYMYIYIYSIHVICRIPTYIHNIYIYNINKYIYI